MVLSRRMTVHAFPFVAKKARCQGGSADKWLTERQIFATLAGIIDPRQGNRSTALSQST